MTHPSKVKGNNFERELVNEAIESGLTAKRAYASNGLSLGYTEDVDCLVDGYRIQAKRRKKIADFLIPSDTVDAVAVRQDRGETLIIVRYTDWLNMRTHGEKK